jgi:hypothetical protein
MLNNYKLSLSINFKMIKFLTINYPLIKIVVDVVHTGTIIWSTLGEIIFRIHKNLPSFYLSLLHHLDFLDITSFKF